MGGASWYGKRLDGVQVPRQRFDAPFGYSKSRKIHLTFGKLKLVGVENDTRGANL